MCLKMCICCLHASLVESDLSQNSSSYPREGIASRQINFQAQHKFDINKVHKLFDTQTHARLTRPTDMCGERLQNQIKIIKSKQKRKFNMTNKNC